MKSLVILSFFLVITAASFGQTCTVTGVSPLNWANPGFNCVEGGNAGGATVLIIPAGFTINFDSNGDTWTGTRIEVSGILNITANPTINASILIKNGGVVNLLGKLSLGTGAGCGYTFVVQTGGKADVGGTGSDRLSICGNDIMKGNGACNDCGGTFSGKCAYNNNPYCEPAGGFTGPTAYGEGGYNGALPITLLNFNATAESEMAKLTWSTSIEENFQKFIVQRSQNGVDFQDLGEVLSVGHNIYGIESKYTFEDKTPLLGFNYYRLKAVDLDETFELFQVKAVKISGNKHFSIFPNPTSGRTLFLSFNFNPSEDAHITVVNHLGVEMLKTSTTAMVGQLDFENDLNPGVYFVKYSSADFQEMVRVIVK